MSADTTAPSFTSAEGAAPPVLAEVVRSGFVESRHRGSMVLLDSDGGVQYALGDPTVPVFPRSSNKPMQAAAMLRAGLDLAGERLAITAASHSGEPFHRELVRAMLAEHGLTPDALQCPPDLPLGEKERAAYLAGGGTPDPVAMNCSGKHTGMLAACLAAGWPIDSYLDPGHPLQLLVRDVVEEASGEPVVAVGVDGCGAPLMAVGLVGLARAFRHFVRAAADTAEGRVAAAMREHPAYVGGSGRVDTELMGSVPGTLSKAGAEGVQAVALPDGRALAIKMEDGAPRALGAVLSRLLGMVGVAWGTGSPVLGGGREVGVIRAAF